MSDFFTAAVRALMLFGLGVEEITKELDEPIEEIREEVKKLREENRLNEMYRRRK